MPTQITGAQITGAQITGAPDIATDVAIVGAGPQALTLVTFLLQKRQQMHRRFMVFDPSGTWMHQWNHQFSALEIPHLRSPVVHHPAPNPFALRAFAENRPNELYPPYDLPGTRLFHDFCQEVIQRWQLADRVYPAQVVRVEPSTDSPLPFRLWLDNGQRVRARRVVMATGGGRVHRPDWVDTIQTPYPVDRLCHSSQIDLQSLHLRGETILIIGGGLTSGHLAIGAINRGAKVLLMARRSVQEKLFDADPGWLGPKHLKGFWAEPDWQTRWQMIQTARDGGSMTPAMLTQLRRLERDGKVALYEQCQVAEANWQDHWRIHCDRYSLHDCIQHQPIDRIWLSTGSTLDITQQSALSEILSTYPIPIVNGLPVLDQHLRWPGCNLFIMGGFAALQVGPTARNLSGARMACECIVPALTKSSIARSPRIAPRL
jgi:cation diffusion facilitator CzcD-associated flavoprotein CzcO